ncbi:hypothetical protein JAO84_27360 [Streptomyces fradiae]
MGVFALFRRKSKDAVETAAVTESVTEETEAAEETAEAGTGTPEPAAEAAAEASAEGGDDSGPVVKDGTVEIPKQQSAEEAADSGATGEGARK